MENLKFKRTGIVLPLVYTFVLSLVGPYILSGRFGKEKNLFFFCRDTDAGLSSP